MTVFRIGGGRSVLFWTMATVAALAGLFAITFDRASNALANWAVRDRVSRAMEEHRTYPPAADRTRTGRCADRIPEE